MTISQRIKARRKELGMSVDELAAKIGKNRATVYRYENGDIENYPIDILKPLAKALQTTERYLIGWDEMSDFDFESQTWTNFEVSSEEKEIIKAFRNADDLHKKMVCELLGIKEKNTISKNA